MLVDFKELSGNSRVWVYQANRPLSNEEVTKVSNKLNLFANTWKAHGADLKSSFLIKYNQFIVIGVDEQSTSASGCSIDASVHTVQELEKELAIDFMNKMNVCFKDGENINTVSIKQFKEFVKLNKINANTIVFNNMVTSKSDFISTWEIQAGKSWHARFLN